MAHEVWAGAKPAPETARKSYGDVLKEAARRRGQSWEDIAAAVGMPASSLRQVKSGRRRPRAEHHRKLAEYLNEPRLHAIFDEFPTSGRSADDGLYADWIGRWYEVVEVGDVEWEGHRIPREMRTVDEAVLRHVGDGVVKGTLKRICGRDDELGAVWDIEGRVLVGDGSLLLQYEEQRRTLPTASRGVIAVKHARGRTDHLHGMYAKYDFDLQLFVPRPLDWFRDKHRAVWTTTPA